jgi:nucleoside-diphosphate-sugar epimerase
VTTTGRTVLVTGAGGYVGGALVVDLAARGHRVVGYGHDTTFARLARALPGTATLVAGDLTDRDAVRRVVGGVAAVVHSGSVTGEASCRRDPLRAVRTIVRGTRNVVDAVLEHGVPALVHLSTYAVYSTFRERPMPLAEDAELAPDDVYGALKAEAEWEASRAPAAILRLTNVFGLGAGLVLKSDVIGRFVRAARAGEPLTLYGDGSQGIDFVHVGDVCRVVAEMLEPPRREGALVLNVGSGGVTSIRRLAGMVADGAREVLGREVPIVSQEAPPGKVWPDRWVSTERIRRLLPWFPATPLAAGVRELLAHDW